MRQHTPGPWFQFDEGGTTYASVVWGPEGPGYGAVAYCSPYSSPTDKDIANARLIAAAPDLLDALNGLLDGLDENRCGLTEGQWSKLILAAWDAIAKAKGE
jgi:hypothetical protein